MRSGPTIAVALIVLGASVGSSGSADLQDFASIERGRYLAPVADCGSCHTIPGSDHPFSGGRPIETPFGTLLSPNITPDRDTGIGAWTADEFEAAVRHGRRRDGARLYPAMPFPYYTRMSREDVTAIRAYLKTVEPVRNAVRVNQLPFPLNIRLALLVWDRLYFKPGEFEEDTSKSKEWNRGAYLVQGPGHCGACHTPKGIGIQEKSLDDSSTSYLAGGALDAWYAPSLRGDLRTGLGTWTKEDIAAFLKQGHNRIGTAFGSMTEAINNSTSYLSDSDINAIATYLKSLPATSAQQVVAYDDATTATLRGRPATQPGGAVYASACASCHGFDAKGFTPYMPALVGNPVVLDDDPSSLINLMLNGSIPLVAKGMPDAYRMPQFRQQLSDADIADVITFIRDGWGNRARPVTAAQVAKLRKTTDPTSDQVIILKMR